MGKLGTVSFYFATFSDKDLVNDVIKRKIWPKSWFFLGRLIVVLELLTVLIPKDKECDGLSNFISFSVKRLYLVKKFRIIHLTLGDNGRDQRFNFKFHQDNIIFDWNRGSLENDSISLSFDIKIFNRLHPSH